MRRLLFLFVILCISGTASALCKPEKMLHVVTAFEAPGMAANDFARKPKTMYRYQNGYGRLEEELDQENHLHLLFVVAEPDLWMVNLADSTGQHMVDPGPQLNFRAPLVPNLESEYWNNLEFGCETQFMEAVGAKPEPVPGTKLRKYTHSAEGITVVLFVRDDGTPVYADVNPGEDPFRIRYETYEFVPPRMDLFEKPRGVDFQESD